MGMPSRQIWTMLLSGWLFVCGLGVFHFNPFLTTETTVSLSPTEDKHFLKILAELLAEITENSEEELIDHTREKSELSSDKLTTTSNREVIFISRSSDHKSSKYDFRKVFFVEPLFLIYQQLKAG